ncbi:uncharacterized protein PHALS_11247 [Plasmopara halstedii]|uniref:Uncharacterized protein n=1 Tax=Plasmopara halstedii TaxID=4781 RepID=A0A0P1AJU7_PLAHL|nr:uncharacterized protein PHALS_11247 [Plasmopara halstedii]CEG41078.1 hypothetical protein PHALS_11247 [Plasmopara halstedii]|eukprot:XP_024577447.1 hypothetical protein PHALS_11247 [Plasmopara halstedii]
MTLAQRITVLLVMFRLSRKRIERCYDTNTCRQWSQMPNRQRYRNTFKIHLSTDQLVRVMAIESSLLCRMELSV